MFKNTFTFFLAVILAVTGLTFCGKGNPNDRPKPEKNAFNKGCHRGKMGGPGNLKLDEKQREAFKNNREAQFKEVKPLLDSIRELQAKLITSSTGDTADLDKAKAIIAQIGSEKIKLKKLEMKNHQELRSLLNPEQKMKFDMMPPFRGHHAKGRRHHGPKHGKRDHGPIRGHDGKKFGRNENFKPAHFKVPDRHQIAKGPHFEKREDRFAEMLGLSDAQKQSFKKAKLALMKTELPVKNIIREKKEELRTLSTQDNVDLTKVNALIDEIENSKIKLMQAKAEHYYNLRSTLSDEQKLKFDLHTSRILSKRKPFKRR